MTASPAGILAPIDETEFELEGEERDRLEALRREKQERLRAGLHDRDQEPGALRQACHPGTEERPVIQTQTATKKASPAFSVEFARPKPNIRDSEPKPAPAGLDALSEAVRRVYDTYQELAPNGCRAVRRFEIAAKLGISQVCVSRHTSKLREAGVYHDGWGSSFAVKKRTSLAEKLSTPEPTKPPPADSPAARAFASHATKHRVTADERRARERDADQAIPVACEVSGRQLEARREAIVVESPPWKRQALAYQESINNVLRSLPDDRELAARVLDYVRDLLAS